VRERKIPAPGGSGKVRKLGIPTIEHRVLQAVLKLVEAHDAVAEVQRFGTKGYQPVLDADIEAWFDASRMA
jgi:RNA-directed DNA polymerase